MAVRYVCSTDGDNAEDGSTWALAKATLAGVAAIDTAGDTIWVSQAHAESTAAAISFAFAATIANPQRIICGDDAAEPPTSLSSAATVSTTGNSDITTANAVPIYWRGISFLAGVGASGTASITCAARHYEACNFTCASTGIASVITLGANSLETTFVDCGFKFSASAQGFRLAGPVVITGGSLLSGGTSPSTLFVPATANVMVRMQGFDFSNASSSIDITATTFALVKVVLRDCKMPASWSGSLNASTPGAGSVYEMINCDSADTHYTYRKHAQLGTIRDETTIVRTGGQDVDGTGISLKMVTNANAEFPMLTLDTFELQKEVTSVGSSVTATVEFLHDSVTALTDAEIWLDIQYLGTSGLPISSFISDGISVVVAPAAQASSSETWTTTGMTNPNKQKLSVTFTPQEAGMIIATVRLAKASYTVYVDPKITLS